MSQRDGNKKQDWCTPPEVVKALHEFFPIGLDPCSNAESIVGAGESYSLPQDGLGAKLSWEHLHVYINPPYGNQRPWAEMAKYRAFVGEATNVTMLIPASPETKLWREVIWPTATAVAFWRKRINFIGSKSGNTLPSALVYWGPSRHRFARHFSKYATIMEGWRCCE